MGLAPGAEERAVTRRQVILEAIAGKITWGAAAEILQMSGRNMRRLKRGYERWGFQALYDRRRHVPSPKRAAVGEVEQVLKLYGQTYRGFNVRHFHEIAVREHGVKLSYSFVKKALQEARLVRKYCARGRHRRRREPRACFGEMLQLDGSEHEWLALCPGQKQTLIAAVDDATKRVCYAELWPSEDLQAVMTAVRQIVLWHGLPMSFYTDRARWAAYTPKAGGPVDKSKPSEFGRALRRLGIDHILSYSPQARGRIERLNRTFQDRLINELRVAGIDTVAQANRYLREGFIERYNERFARAPADPESAFVALGSKVDLDQILCREDERVVGRDNVVSFEGTPLQIDKQSGRRSCAGLRVLVRHHLDGSYSVWRAGDLLGRFDAAGKPLSDSKPQRPAPPRRLAPSNGPRRPLPLPQSGQITCQT
jgi:hypothetical protein